MTLEYVGTVGLPPHVKDGGFDHAAVDSSRGRLYVAYTANDAIDIIERFRRELRAVVDGNAPPVVGG